MPRAKIPIEKGIPMPPARRGNKAGSSKVWYPWGDMEIGDSFQFVEGVAPKGAWTAASRTHLRTGHKYAVRLVDGRLRAWRTA